MINEQELKRQLDAGLITYEEYLRKLKEAGKENAYVSYDVRKKSNPFS